MSSKNRIDEIIKALDWIANETEFVFAADTLREAANIIREAVPAVHGKWIPTGKYMTDKCSRCAFEINWDKIDYCDMTISDIQHCPKCGAKMEGD